MSQEPDKKSIDPKKIDDTYDSYYMFSEQKLPLLVAHISNLLTSAVRLADIQGTDTLQDVPLADLMSGIECLPILKPVNYVNDKSLVVTKAENFNQSSLFNLYFEGLFKKNIQHAGNQELRLVFALRHRKLGFLSVRKEPIKLKLKPILDYLAE